MKPLAFLCAALLTLATGATADPPGACMQGVPYDSGLTLSVDGQAQAQSGPGVFGPYAVSLCRVQGQGQAGNGGTNTYNFSVQRAQGNNAVGLTADDTAKSFTITFTPTDGDTPLAAEGKANITAFTIDAANANAVSLTASPLGFADIQGCQEMPTQCVTDHPTASFYNPANLTGIHAAQAIFPGLPNVGVFDTAFHQTMPEHAYTYAIPRELYRKYGLRRYGFHGTSYRYVAQAAADLLGKPLKDTALVIAHLGIYFAPLVACICTFFPCISHLDSCISDSCTLYCSLDRC